IARRSPFFPYTTLFRSLTSAMKAIRRSLSSCLEVTRTWRSTERASLEKKPSMRLSHEPWVGVNVKVKRPIGWAASQIVVSRETRSEEHTSELQSPYDLV